ncbi:hypothetical protein GXP67_20300 [Rhodocytophaga rosea]|uniref:AlgX/AlgJ SGNH hydrolase-like domain-containing protein n=1 Tax=Rhodocytophaga rosea TaxID=2704465 RepID=A0A6C0GMJ0_9BACT|nr:hypothetical protein [Rhodocytophaga rosea]QHT68822.1 hypothetical protein GXP67_20300 [Rhodocytophaga rosea]
MSLLTYNKYVVKNEKNQIKITFDIISEKQDNLQLFYITNLTDGFTEEHSLTEPIKEGIRQQVTFVLPIDHFTGLRIDLGDKSKQNIIRINKVVFAKNTTYSLQEADITKFFNLNHFVKYNQDTHNFSLQTVDGSYDPFIYSTSLSSISDTLHTPDTYFIPAHYTQYILLGLFCAVLSVLFYIYQRNKQVTVLHFGHLTIWVVLCFVLIKTFTYLKVDEIFNTNKVSLKIIVKMEVDDYFQVYYTTPAQPDWTEQQSITTNITGESGYQVINFQIPDSLQIIRLRLDISQNKLQKEIELKEVTIEHNGEAIYYDQSNFLTVFINNICLAPAEDSSKLKFIPQTVDNYYDPFFYAQEIGPDYEKVRGAKNSVAFTEALAFLLSFCVFLFLESNYAYTPSLSLTNKILILQSFSFIVLLLLPLISDVFKFDTEGGVNIEKRQLQSKPAFSLDSVKEFPSLYTDYFNDNFNFRRTLIDWGGKLRLFLFNESQVSNQAIIGNQGWLFLSVIKPHENVLADYAHRNLYTQEELEVIHKNLENIHTLCKSNNIKYYKAYYPNTHTIYSEFLPFRIKVQQLDTVSRIEQLNRFLRQKKSAVSIIDIKADLLRQKQNAQLYYKHDTHWNNYGAFIGYSSLFNHISKDFSGLKPLPISDFTIKWVKEGGGDLIDLIGMQNNTQFIDNKPYFLLKNSSDSISNISSSYPDCEIYENSLDTTGITAVVFHDSYTLALKPFMNRHFKRIVYCWKNFDWNIVEKEKPDVVIEGYVERLFR